MSKLQDVSYLIGADQGTRVDNDFYPTPFYVTEALLAQETFSSKIIEPACGEGHISKVLESKGYEVLSTDLVNRGYGTGGINFLTDYPTGLLSNPDYEGYDLITNPPFSLATKFALHALELPCQKVALFNKLTFLEGIERRKKLFCNKTLKTVYVFSERVGFLGHKAGMLAFAWYVWDKSYNGSPKIEWI